MTVWSFFVLRENKPHVLDDLPPADEAKRVARENGLRQEVSNGEVGEPGEEPEPETRPDQQPQQTEAESPAEQTDRSSVEPQVRCLSFFIFIFITFFFFFILTQLIFLLMHQEDFFFTGEKILASSLSFSWTDPILEILTKSN